MFGFCMTGSHNDCTTPLKAWYFGSQRKDRRVVETIVYTDKIFECDCRCHKKGKK